MPESLLFLSSRSYLVHDKYWIEISLQRRELSQFVHSEMISIFFRSSMWTVESDLQKTKVLPCDFLLPAEQK